jgi:hypothetical protein
MQYALKLSVSCVCLVSLQAFAGTIMNTQTREFGFDPPTVGTTTIFADGKLLRVEIESVSSGENGLLIFRGDRNEMIVAENDSREYYVIDEQTMNQMAAQVSDAMRQMDEMLSSMPPEQRAIAEQMMKQQMPGLQAPPEIPSTVNKTGESDTINGFDCQYFEVMQDGRKIRDMCVAAWADIDGGKEATDAMTGIGEFLEKMHDAFSQSAGINLMGRQQEMFAHMKELGGYPVYTRDYDEAGELESEASLRSSRSEPIDASMFEPPEGYNKQEMSP